MIVPLRLAEVVSASPAREIRERNAVREESAAAAMTVSPLAAKVVGASPTSELREGKAARVVSTAAAMAVADSPPSEMDG